LFGVFCSIGNSAWKRDALKIKLEKKVKTAQERRQAKKKNEDEDS